MSQPRATTSVDDAKRVARRLLEKYDSLKKGQLSQQDMGPILSDVYKSVKIQYVPNQADQNSYFTLLDTNKDRQVTLQDLEEVCIRYLCNYNSGATTTTTTVHQHVDGSEHKKHAGHHLDHTSQYQSYGGHTSSYQPQTTTSYQTSSYQQQQPQTSSYQTTSYQQGQTSYQTSSYQPQTTSYQTSSYQQGGYQTSSYQQQSNTAHIHEYHEDHEHHNPPEEKKQPSIKKNIIPVEKQGNAKHGQENIFKDPSKIERQNQIRVNKNHVGRPSPKLDSILARLGGQPFTDPEFPPNTNSLACTGEWLDGEDIPFDGWIRATKYFGDDLVLFAEGITPSDIRQGELGDCYLQCSIAALAEWPRRIQNLFSKQEANKQGIYSLWFVWEGVLTEVVVDDHLWFNTEEESLVSMQTTGPEIWAQLIEKAWAKLNGDYCAIDGGFARDALHDLTGAPVIHYRIEEKARWEKWHNILWEQLKKGEEKDYIMSAGSYGENPEGDEVGDTEARDGIFYGHAYSILSAFEITDQQTGQPLRLIRFRNPHGEGEWTGDFSDEDNKNWARVSQADKQKIGWSDEDDGMFFMEYHDLQTYFADVQICQASDYSEYKGVRVNSQGQQHYFQVDIRKPGIYYFQVNQRTKAAVDKLYRQQGNDDSDYTYVQATCNVVNQNGQQISACYGRQKNITSYKTQQNQHEIPAGTYYVMAQVALGSVKGTIRPDYFGFGVYGPDFEVREIQSAPGNCQQALNNPQDAEKLPSFVI